MLKDLKTTKLRLLQMHYEAGVGHIGGNLSCLEILYTLQETMEACDQLVISKGHAAGAYYVTQWAAGKDIDLTTFHQDGTELAGHLPNTGSLGHGLGLATGYALHKKLWREPGTVYCVMSDGEWDEGSNWEAIRFINENALEPHIKIIIDHNYLQGFTEFLERTQSLGTELAMYHPVWVTGHDTYFLKEAITTTHHLIIACTHKGNGISFLENKMESHYDPLTKEQYEQAVKEVSSAENVC